MVVGGSGRLLPLGGMPGAPPVLPVPPLKKEEKKPDGFDPSYVRPLAASIGAGALIGVVAIDVGADDECFPVADPEGETEVTDIPPPTAADLLAVVAVVAIAEIALDPPMKSG